MAFSLGNWGYSERGRPVPYHSQPEMEDYSPTPERLEIPLTKAPEIKRQTAIEADKAKYISAISKLGYDTKDVERLDTIRIDKLGYSTEVAGILGEGYLKDNFIILDATQACLGSLKPAYSFTEEVADVAYGKIGKHIEVLSHGEPIVADLNVVLDDTRKKFSIDLEFDTPSKHIKKLNEVRAKARCITPHILMDKGKLQEIINEVNELREIYGDIRQFDSITNNVELSVSSYKSEIGGTYSYFFAEEGLAIHFGKQGAKSALTNVDGNDKKAVKRGLFSAKLLSLDKRGIESRIDEMELLALKKKYGDEDAESIRGGKKKDLFGYYSSLKGANAFLDKRWSKMKTLFEGGRKPSLDEVDMEFFLPSNKPFVGEVMEKAFGSKHVFTETEKPIISSEETPEQSDPIDEILSKPAGTGHSYGTSLID